MAISTADFKNGMCIVNNGKMCTIVEFQHVKPGKGGAFVRTKLRDIKTGRVVDYTFNAGTKFDTVRLETRKMQYLYNDGSDFYFMDPNTYDQMSMPAETVGDTAKWLKENDEASLLLEKIAQQCSVSIRGLQGISCYPPVTDQFSILIYTTDDIRISYIKSKKHVHLLQVNGA